MNRSFNRLIAAAVGLSLAPAAWALMPARSFTPAWTQGQHWAIRTQYRSLGATSAQAAEAWSDPVIFDYTVASVQTREGQSEYTLKVAPRSQATAFATTLVVRAGERGRMYVRSVESIHRRMGQIVKDQRTFDVAGPVFTESSIIPYEMPAFPLTKPSTLGADAYLTVRQATTRNATVGGLKFAATTQQQVLSPSAVSAYVDTQGQPVELDVDARPDQVFAVSVEEPATGRRVSQYWADGHPWALYSETASTRSVLIRQ